MRFLFFWGMLLTVSSIKAQYTITAAQKPTIGDVYNYVLIDTTNVSFNTSGPNQNWDFTYLNIPNTASISTQSYISSSNIPNSTWYQGAYMAIYFYPGYYWCYDADTNNLSMNWIVPTGSGVYPFARKYANSYTKYHYPIQYGSTFSDSVRYNDYDQQSGIILPGSYTFYGTNSYVCDSYGTLNLPNGISLPNTMKLSILYFKYSANGNHLHKPWTDSVCYEEYFNPISKFPILSIVKTYIFNYRYFPDYNVYNKTVSLNSVVISSLLDKDLINNSVDVFPNPAKHKFQIHFNDLVNSGNISNISILNSLGQKVGFTSEIDYTNNNVIINLKDNNPGIYVISLQINEHFITKKILVER